MALLSAIASGPISYVSGPTQAFIPVSGIQFNDTTGAIGFVDPNASYANMPGALLWLNQLRQSGYLRPSERPVRRLAMIIESRDAGASGNEIAVTFTPTGTTFTMEVLASHTYTNKTLAELKALLGTETLPGTQPGLVRFRDTDMPLDNFPEEVTNLELSDGNDGGDIPVASITADIEKEGESGVVAFRLAARRPGVGGDNIKVTIAHVDPPNTLSLTVTWRHIALGLDPNVDLASTLQTEFGYLISITPPDGSAFAMPDAGTITLSGGTEAGKASARPVMP